MARALDHVVFPVASLERARERYEALGFTVAPDGRHPFGTENACIHLADGTFIEPLAVARREECEAAITAANTFVANDHAYRFRRGLEGFSHLVVKSQDAGTDHDAYRSLGMSDGDMVRFSRKFATPAGDVAEAEFALAFAGDRRAPDAGFFACEVVRSPDVDRTALRSHPNGAVGLAEVVLSETNPTDFQYLLQTFLDQRIMDNHSFGIELATDGGKVSVLTAAGMRAFCGFDADTTERGLLLQCVSLRVRSIALVRELLRRGDVEHREVGPRILVPPAPGQGAPILFEEDAK